MKTIYTLVFIFFSICISFAQEVFNPINYGFDCYSKVQLPELTKTLYVYDGVDPSIETQEFTIILKTGKTKWVKKKADRNCLSSNPDDCLVWCLEEETTPKIFNIVKDTSATTEWFPYKYTIRKKGQTINEQVLCKNELTQELLDALKTKLYSLGYDLKPNKGYKKLKGKFMREFKVFQEDYNLPIGKWTLLAIPMKVCS
jgi:hypothetical protein